MAQKTIDDVIIPTAIPQINHPLSGNAFWAPTKQIVKSNAHIS